MKSGPGRDATSAYGGCQSAIVEGRGGSVPPGDETALVPPPRAGAPRLPRALRRLVPRFRVVVRAAAVAAAALLVRLLDRDADPAHRHGDESLLGLPLLRPPALDGGAGGGAARRHRRHRQLAPGQEA